MRTSTSLVWMGAIVTASAFACEPAPSAPLVDPSPERPDASATLPGASRTELSLADTQVAQLMDVEACRDCHGDVVAHWEQSAHAFASFDNPWYRATIDLFRQERGNEASRFCAGCHDPVLLAGGAIDSEVSPDDPRAHAGVPCMVCHSIQQTTGEGNGSYDLVLEPPLIPDPNNADEVRAHVVRMTPEPLRTASLCGSCHRSFLGPDMGNPHHLPGIDDVGSWRQSAFAGSHASRLDEEVDRATCQGCHMELSQSVHDDFAADDQGRFRSHRVPGAQTAIAAQVGPEVLAATRKRLEGAASIDVIAVRSRGRWHVPAESASELSSELDVDVVIRNQQTGHFFPGGTRDLQDTWIELEIYDEQGLVAEAGTAHEGSDDPSALRLRAVLLDDEGRPDDQHLVHRFRARAFDKTVAARDALVVRYRALLPREPVGQVRFEARLRHRRHPAPMRELACAATRSERGRAFAATSRRLGRVALDACAEHPVTEVAGVTRRVGDPVTDLWQRLYDYGLGLSHDVQDRLDEALSPIQQGLGVAPQGRPRAMMLSLLATVDARQGRLSQALSNIERAEALVGSHPALHRLRGYSFAQVWKWPQAADAFQHAAELAPEDALAWRDFARALGSSAQDWASLEATHRGLPFAPRQPDLLRSQALALERLEDDDASTAHQAFLAHRVVDEQPQLLRRCQAEVPGCNRDRQPVPVVEMRSSLD